MDNFTPGPWTFERNGGDRYIRGGGTALMCDTDYYPWTPTSDDDWSLIAAAPEMYEALQKIANGMAFKQDAEGVCVSDARTVALAALAKVEEKAVSNG